MKIRKAVAALGLVAALSSTAACATDVASAASGTSTSSTAAGSAADTSTDTSTGSTGSTGTTTTTGRGNRAAGGGGSVSVGSVTTEAQLVALIQEAYGNANLGLHRGHQPIQDVLTAVLKISHEELHVRMEEQGQNLAAVATDLGIDPQTLIDALVKAWSPAIDTLQANGTITQSEADAYRAELVKAFTFRVTWDGTAATPTVTALSA